MLAIDYPMVQLRNDALEVRIYLPDAMKGYYRAQRFEWAGLIAQVTRAGHTYFGELRPEHDPLGHDHVPGPAEEFSLSNPPGFAEAPVGGTFLKIGVGLLQKTQEKYFFSRPHPVVKSPERTWNRDATSVTFHEVLAGEYEYTKVIGIAGNKVTVRHALKNLSPRAFHTDHYCHNIIRIDGDPVGSSHVLELPFVPKANLPAGVRFDGARMMFTTERANKFHCVFQDFGAAAFTVRNQRTGAAITTSVDKPASAWAVYCEDTGLCPEPFIKIYLAPGGEFNWTTTMEFR